MIQGAADVQEQQSHDGDKAEVMQTAQEVICALQTGHGAIAEHITDQVALGGDDRAKSKNIKGKEIQADVHPFPQHVEPLVAGAGTRRTLGCKAYDDAHKDGHQQQRPEDHVQVDRGTTAVFGEQPRPEHENDRQPVQNDHQWIVTFQ